MLLLQVLGSGAGTLAALAAGTMFLRRRVRVERVSVIDAAPADILALAASNAGYQKFNPYKKADPALKIELFGPSSGVGSGFTFDGKDGKGTAVISNVTAERVDYALDLGVMGKPQQSLVVVPDGKGSKVTWTMTADMGMNPIGRVMGMLMDGIVGPTFESGLKSLNAALQS
ncbi:MAG: SRPBCC family protein [Deltaproteobacteria bacterium]|nr:SRPBCC family protein [Deltaproteobacteria bacterium]